MYVILRKFTQLPEKVPSLYSINILNRIQDLVKFKGVCLKDTIPL